MKLSVSEEHGWYEGRILHERSAESPIPNVWSNDHRAVWRLRNHYCPAVLLGVDRPDWSMKGRAGCRVTVNTFGDGTINRDNYTNFHDCSGCRLMGSIRRLLVPRNVQYFVVGEFFSWYCSRIRVFNVCTGKFYNCAKCSKWRQLTLVVLHRIELSTRHVTIATDHALNISYRGAAGIYDLMCRPIILITVL
jgi:hypothetical protein